MKFGLSVHITTLLTVIISNFNHCPLKSVILVHNLSYYAEDFSHFKNLVVHYSDVDTLYPIATTPRENEGIHWK